MMMIQLNRNPQFDSPAAKGQRKLVDRVIDDLRFVFDWGVAFFIVVVFDVLDESTGAQQELRALDGTVLLQDSSQDAEHLTQFFVGRYEQLCIVEFLWKKQSLSQLAKSTWCTSSSHQSRLCTASRYTAGEFNSG